jgi:hypothetical protein
VIIIALNALFQFGINAYKHQQVKVSDKVGKELISKGFATEVKIAKKKK